ncbi:MAG: hypothetical protein AAGH79_01290 [Bacteroidota bacterium]
MTRILYFGKNPAILPVILRLINAREDWEGEGSIDLEKIKSRLNEESFNLLLLGGGLRATEESHLRDWCKAKYPKMPIIQHYGGGSGLLYNEIEQAFQQTI